RATFATDLGIAALPLDLVVRVDAVLGEVAVDAKPPAGRLGRDGLRPYLCDGHLRTPLERAGRCAALGTAKKKECSLCSCVRRGNERHDRHPWPSFSSCTSTPPVAPAAPADTTSSALAEREHYAADRRCQGRPRIKPEAAMKRPHAVARPKKVAVLARYAGAATAFARAA